MASQDQAVGPALTRREIQPLGVGQTGLVDGSDDQGGRTRLQGLFHDPQTFDLGPGHGHHQAARTAISGETRQMRSPMFAQPGLTDGHDHQARIVGHNPRQGKHQGGRHVPGSRGAHVLQRLRGRRKGW